MREFFRTAADRHILLQGLRVALVVGTILNLINQGSVLLSLELGQVIWWQLCLTFLVPFCVSVYASTRTAMRSTGST